MNILKIHALSYNLPGEHIDLGGYKVVLDIVIVRDDSLVRNIDGLSEISDAVDRDDVVVVSHHTVVALFLYIVGIVVLAVVAQVLDRNVVVHHTFLVE